MPADPKLQQVAQDVCAARKLTLGAEVGSVEHEVPAELESGPATRDVPRAQLLEQLAEKHFKRLALGPRRAGPEKCRESGAHFGEDRRRDHRERRAFLRESP